MTAPDPADGPFRDRMHAGEVFARFRQAAESGTFGPRDRFLADALVDAVDSFPGAEMGAYDRQLAAWLGELLDPVDVGVICSWIRRAARDRPDDTVHIVNPDLPEAGQ